MKKSMCFLLSVIMAFCITMQSFAADIYIVNEMVNDTAAYIYKAVSNPNVGSVGGEWSVIGLARSGAEISEEYYLNYYKNVEEYVKACDGVLHEKKYTEYSRVILALTAIGKDPSNVAGYNLLKPLGDYEKTIWQGVNGPIWALIALDSGNYEIPENSEAETQATREMYINRIIECQLPDGGWSLFGGTAADDGEGISEPDITAMALQALAKYQDNTKVKEATEKALLCMSKKQNENGGFSSEDTENCESCAQMIVALCELGISLEDSRFVKNKNTLFDNLKTYYNNGNGFRHTFGASASDQMTSEQGLYSIVALKRFLEGKNSLYNMSDVDGVSDMKELTDGLKDKNPDIRKMNIVSPGKTFVDIIAHENQSAIEALTERGIISGKSEQIFEPDSTMTRAEFAAIVVKGFGLPIKNNETFSDVTAEDWFCGFVNTAYDYGIASGVSETEFNPYGTITKEEAAVMITRGAKLCGMNTEIEAFEARDVLSEFVDYVRTSDWALSSLAFCIREQILSENDIEIQPHKNVTRAEIAQMIFNMLKVAELL